MKAQLARPRVQDGGEPQSGAEMAVVATELDQRLRCAREERLKKLGAPEADQRMELRRHGEDHMKVTHRQNALLTLGDPLRLREALALWAMPIAT